MSHVSQLRRMVLIGVTTLMSVGLMALPASASPTPKAVKFTVTVAPGPWAAVQAFLPTAANGGVYSSGADLIYSSLCEDSGSWTAPIPRKISQGPSGVKFQVKLSANQVGKADKALRAAECPRNYGIRTVEQDYKWASRNAQVAAAVNAADSQSTTTASTTTTTTVPPESPAQYEAACTNTPVYGQLTSPTAQTGLCVTYQAEVFQYDTNTGPTEMLVDVTNDGYGLWTDVVELLLPQSAVSQNLIQNDVIQFWGTTTTPDTYQTESGGTNTVPAVAVKYVTLVSAASS
jgi:hypothetical protein